MKYKIGQQVKIVKNKDGVGFDKYINCICSIDDINKNNLHRPYGINFTGKWWQEDELSLLVNLPS